ITMMLGLTSDPNAYVRIGALSAIGRCLEYPCLREDECFLVDATSCLIKSCRDSNLSVVMKATWSISNLTDALLPNKDENSYPSSLLLELYTTSCDLCTKNDKTRSNALRALGNLLNFTPKQFIESEKFREVMDLSLKLINNYMTSGSVKVRWNACYAYGKLMKNEFAYNQVHPNIKVITIFLYYYYIIIPSLYFSLSLSLFLSLS
ncbi:hypothetical protein HELRODRAFT_75516, partial [Helobdella robusta]|uniref:HEAT repeat-containing protein 6 n=1 Tax=Helobdella robusta TaxID=6412 RepID=T1G261_HELRO